MNDPLSTDVGDVEEAYADLDPMPFGKYQGVPLQDVPASYFHYLWQHRPISDKRLEKYIIKSLHAFQQERPDLLWS